MPVHALIVAKLERRFRALLRTECRQKPRGGFRHQGNRMSVMLHLMTLRAVGLVLKTVGMLTGKQAAAQQSRPGTPKGTPFNLAHGIASDVLLIRYQIPRRVKCGMRTELALCGRGRNGNYAVVDQHGVAFPDGAVGAPIHGQLPSRDLYFGIAAWHEEV